MKDQPAITCLGTSALLFDPGGVLNLPLQQRIWALAEATRHWPEFRESVPCLNNLLLSFALPAPRQIDTLKARLLDEWNKGEQLELKGKTVELVVNYGGEYGLRMPHVCEHTGLKVDDVVELHSSPDYIVFGLGSHPGHCYLEGLDRRLATPRRQVPILDNPMGSVAIGGIQTSVAASPAPAAGTASVIPTCAFSTPIPGLRP